MALCAFALAQGALAANTGTISVTVSLASTISVDVTPTAWDLGAVQLSSVSSPTSFTATVGNTATQLQIEATNPVAGWTIGAAPASDVFQVSVINPALSLTLTFQTLAATVPHYGHKNFALTYHAPTSDTKGAETNESFTITVKASAAP
jgi:hypothetical protein